MRPSPRPSRVVLAVLWCLGVGSAVAAPPAPTPTKPAPRPARQVTLPRGSSLPDTVLARVGTRRRVTASDFRVAWDQLTPPSRPDSLTPESARRFLDLLIDKEVLAEHAAKVPFRPTEIESAQVVALKDQMMLQVALDSAMTRTRREREAKGDSALTDEALGVVVRDRTIATMDVRYDDALADRLAGLWRALPKPSRDSTLFAQLRALGALPHIPPADSTAAIAQSADGPYLVHELYASWKATNPLSRPRVENAAQIKDLVNNGLFERRLRLSAAKARYDRRPEIVAAVARRREFQQVSHYVDREVYAKLADDSLTLRRFYDAHVAEYALAERVEVIRILLPNRPDAQKMGARLLDAAEAESLAARGLRQRVRYRAEVTAQTDSALFTQAWRAGVGAVVGPDSVRGGWQVARVTALKPERRREYEEVRDGVQQHHYNLEGERLMRELVDRLRKRTTVTVNGAGVARLTKS